MKKHRIVLKKEGGNEYFVVERRAWLFFWIPYFDGNEHEIRFNSIEKAVKFINLPEEENSKTVVKCL